MFVLFNRREQLAPEIWQYYFEADRPLDYEPGQYTSFHFLHNLADPRGASRTFTLTSLPSDRYLSFSVKIQRNPSQYKKSLLSLQPGDRMRIDDAMGDIMLPKSPYVPLVFIAGGLGIASYIGMLKQLRRSGQARKICLFYARRTEADSPYQDLLAAFPFVSYQEYIKPMRLNISSVLAAITPETLIYLSGSESFVESIGGALRQNNVEQEQIIFDFFDGYTSL